MVLSNKGLKLNAFCISISRSFPNAIYMWVMWKITWRCSELCALFLAPVVIKLDFLCIISGNCTLWMLKVLYRFVKHCGFHLQDECIFRRFGSLCIDLIVGGKDGNRIFAETEILQHSTRLIHNCESCTLDSNDKNMTAIFLWSFTWKRWYS